MGSLLRTEPFHARGRIDGLRPNEEFEMLFGGITKQFSTYFQRIKRLSPHFDAEKDEHKIARNPLIGRFIAAYQSNDPLCKIALAYGKDKPDKFGMIMPEIPSLAASILIFSVLEPHRERAMKAYTIKEPGKRLFRAKPVDRFEVVNYAHGFPDEMRRFIKLAYLGQSGWDDIIAYATKHPSQNEQQFRDATKKLLSDGGHTHHISPREALVELAAGLQAPYRVGAPPNHLLNAAYIAKTKHRIEVHGTWQQYANATYNTPEIKDLFQALIPDDLLDIWITKNQPNHELSHDETRRHYAYDLLTKYLGLRDWNPTFDTAMSSVSLIMFHQ